MNALTLNYSPTQKPLFLLVLFFGGRRVSFFGGLFWRDGLSGSPDWPQIYFVALDEFELLTVHLLSPSPGASGI